MHRLSYLRSRWKYTSNLADKLTIASLAPDDKQLYKGRAQGHIAHFSARRNASAAKLWSCVYLSAYLSVQQQQQYTKTAKVISRKQHRTITQGLRIFLDSRATVEKISTDISRGPVLLR